MKELSLHILDILENSLEAKSKKVELYIWEDTIKNLLTIKITDDGRGMTKEVLDKAGMAFNTTKEETNSGLGLYLLKGEAELTGGNLCVMSERGKGTTVIATFKLNSPNLKPMGDIADCLAAFLHRTENLELKYIHLKDDKEYIFDTKKIKKELGIKETKSNEIIENLKKFFVTQFSA
jgi:hypothetical protein